MTRKALTIEQAREQFDAHEDALATQSTEVVITTMAAFARLSEQLHDAGMAAPVINAAIETAFANIVASFTVSGRRGPGGDPTNRVLQLCAQGVTAGMAADLSEIDELTHVTTDPIGQPAGSA